MKEFSTHAISWALMSSHKHSCALMSSHEHSWVLCYGAMSARECWWVPMTSWHHTHDYSWALMSAHYSIAPRLWVPIAAHVCSLVIRSTHGFSWLLMSAHECSWLFMSTLEQPWTLLSLAPWSNEPSLELKSNHEHGTMGPWALISTHECSWHHSTILLSALECSWVHMSAYESSWALMRTHECWTALLKNKQKMLTFKITSLWYLANISVYISPDNEKLDIFKIYTKWAVEKCTIWNF